MSQAKEKTKSILKEAPVVATEKPGGELLTFRVDMKYRNTLPSIPFDPKFLDVPFASDFLWGYRLSSLERNYKYRIHMNPPQLRDDMVDPLGAEEWAKSIELDSRDEALIKKEGADVKVARRFASTAREKKTWMVKTSYTTINQHSAPGSSAINAPDDTSRQILAETEDEDLKLASIERQFEEAKMAAQDSSSLSNKLGKKIKSVRPLVPDRFLRELNLHLVRFKGGESIVGDIGASSREQVLNRALLVHRVGDVSSQQNPFHPLSLFCHMTKDGHKSSENDEDEGLFSSDNEEPSNEKDDSFNHNYVHYLREYMVQSDKSQSKLDRIALAFDEKVVRYFELDQESLRLHRQRIYKDEEERVEAEFKVKLKSRSNPTTFEQEARKRRRVELEGTDRIT